MYENMELPGMCNWCIEEDTGWFVAYSVNTLFKYDMKTKILSAVSSIPTKKAGAFQNPLCIKYKNRIYCLPYYQNSIWYYDLTSGQWSEVLLCQDKNIAVMACSLGKQTDTYYFFSMTLKKIWGLNLERGTITASYHVNVEGQSDVYYCYDGILVEDRIYLVFGGTTIFEYNLSNHSQRQYEVPNVEDTLYRIGFDGEAFWLIGKKKDVYMWNQKSETVSIMEKYPDDFAIYDFAKSVKSDDFEHEGQDLFVYNNIYCLGDKVWLIPQSGSKIMYYDKNDGQIKGFEIQDEEETAETLDLNYRHIATKFFMMYIREHRYLGIYSYKNKRMLEIDTLHMNYKNIDVIMDDRTLSEITIQDFYEDGNESTYLLYNAKIEKPKTTVSERNHKSVGSQIYMEIK